MPQTHIFLDPDLTAKLRTQFNARRLSFVQTELRVALGMAGVAQRDFLRGDVAKGRRAVKLMRAARDVVSRYLPKLHSAGLSAEAKRRLDSAMDELQSAVENVEQWEEAKKC